MAKPSTLAAPYPKQGSADGHARSAPTPQALQPAPPPAATPIATQNGIPEYLIRHYGWAYLSPRGMRFFDRPAIINLILFGQYRALKEETLRCLTREAAGETLQLACVYGDFSTRMQQALDGQRFHLADVLPGQIKLSQQKIKADKDVCFSRMDAASLAYRDDSLDTIVVFFLLHELPPEVRERTLNECLRVLKPGGRLLITEFASPTNFLTHLDPRRHLLARAEPWLKGFLGQDLNQRLEQMAVTQGKSISRLHHRLFGGGLYGVNVFKLESLSVHEQQKSTLS